MGISVGNIIPFNPDIIMRIVRKKGGNMIRDKFLKNKRIKKLLASMAVFVSAVCVCRKESLCNPVPSRSSSYTGRY